MMAKRTDRGGDPYSVGDFTPVVTRCAVAKLLSADLVDECIEEEVAVYLDESRHKSAGELALRRGYVTWEDLSGESKRVEKQFMDAGGQVLRGGDISDLAKLMARFELLGIVKEQAELARQGSYVTLADLAARKGLLEQKPPEEPGRVRLPEVDGYEMIDAIGRGGMGTVYKARQLSMDRLVAIKVLHPERTRSPGFVRRFMKEARGVARLNHPNIVGGIDCGQCGDLYYLVMEYFEGQPVSHLIRERGTLDEADALLITLQVAQALEAAREVGIIHRDIKPGNMLINERSVVKLTDLGLVKIEGPNLRDEETLTSALTTVGTPQYLSPEQAKGQTVDTRSDIYSLGISLFTMLAGRFPFDGSPLEVIVKHIMEPVPSIKDFAPDVSERTRELIRKMTSKLPEHRYQTPHEVVAEIVSIVEDLGGKTASKLREDQAVARARAAVGGGDTSATASMAMREMLESPGFDGISSSPEDFGLYPDASAPGDESTTPGSEGTGTAPTADVDEESREAISQGTSAVGHPVRETVSTADEELVESAPAREVLRLVALDGPMAGQKFDLDEGQEVAVGSDRRSCHVVIEAPGVSPQHCALTNEGGQVLVLDLGSEGGTFINEGQITTGYAKPGDVVRVGYSRLRIAREKVR
jgi:serine/threonine protein kinase